MTEIEILTGIKDSLEAIVQWLPYTAGLILCAVLAISIKD
jgi:hypothetical protein